MKPHKSNTLFHTLSVMALALTTFTAGTASAAALKQILTMTAMKIWWSVARLKMSGPLGMPEQSRCSMAQPAACLGFRVSSGIKENISGDCQRRR